MARCGLKASVALALCLAAEGQFLRGFPLGAGTGSSYMFSFSSVWSRGSDGQMHQQVQEASSENVQTEYGMQHVEKKTDCKDGHCRQDVMVTSGMSAKPSAPLSMWLHPCLRAVLHLVHRGRESVVVVMPEGVPQPLMEQPPPMVLTDAMLPPPSLRSSSPKHAGPNGYPMAELSVPPRGRPSVAPMMLGDAALTVFGAMTASFGAAILLFCIVFKLHEKFVSAREVSDLAQPLALADNAPKGQAGHKRAAQQPEAVAAKVAQGYLQGLYAKGQAKAEALILRRYLASVYQRAIA